jgi:hypothetical protein
MKMGRRLGDVVEASSLCPPGRSKARRFAYAALPTAHFDRNKMRAISGTGRQISLRFLPRKETDCPAIILLRHASVLVLVVSLLLGACAATDTGKKDDPVFYGGAGGDNGGGGATSGMSFRW